MSIPKLGNQKFSTLAELLQEQDGFNVNVSQTSMTQRNIMCIPVSKNMFTSHLTIASLRSMDGSGITFTPDQQNVMCSNFQSQGNQGNNPVLGEITADQILDMPIVFADEASQEETNQMTDNSSYVYPSTNFKKELIKEEPFDNEDEDVDIMCSPVSRTAIPERLNIKQVYTETLYI